jgi:hypothetical protein
VILKNTLKAILIVPMILVLLGAVIPHSQRAFAQVDCNATPDDPSCQSSSSPPPSDNNNPPADNSQPSQPSTQTCPDGSVIDASATCTTPPTPPQPSTQTCPDGSVIDASATCPTPTSTTGSNNQPNLSCNPNVSNPSSACRQASQPDSSGSCPSGTGITPYGSCCPHGTMNGHAFCHTKDSQDAKAQRIPGEFVQKVIGGVCTIGGLVGGPIGHFAKSTVGQLVCQ